MTNEAPSAGDPDPDGGATATEEYDPPDDPDIDYLLGHLEDLEESVDDPDERAQVRKTMRIARRIPGTEVLEKEIQKYTTRDMAEAFVGGILLSLPMLVEDGVFVIADWFLETWIAGVPIFLAGNVAFVVVLTIGLIYWSDIREVQITNPVFGVIPRRLIGVTGISMLTVLLLMLLWGRHRVGDPAGPLELFSRVTVIWAAAAIGASLGDILPGESRGHDITVENLDEIVGADGD